MTQKQPLMPFAHTPSNSCFGCGPANTTGLHLTFFIATDGSLICETTVSDQFHGHPGYLHGGIIATLLDEAMSKAVRATGKLAMTRHMEIDYRLPVPIGAPLRIEGRLLRGDGRKHWAESAIRDARGKELARAKGLFIEIRAQTSDAASASNPTRAATTSSEN